uniref:Uncharacterized protein n=1 Tax=Arundo donax TaxID=35708 RepID=A0A0A8YAG5_ARUDO
MVLIHELVIAHICYLVNSDVQKHSSALAQCCICRTSAPCRTKNQLNDATV